MLRLPAPAGAAAGEAGADAPAPCPRAALAEPPYPGAPASRAEPESVDGPGRTAPQAPATSTPRTGPQGDPALAEPSQPATRREPHRFAPGGQPPHPDAARAEPTPPAAPAPRTAPPAHAGPYERDHTARPPEPGRAGGSRGEVPAAREAAPVGIPHPQGSGVPGPGVAEIVAQAVARGIDGRDGVRGDGDAGPLARRGPVRGAAVTEVPVHLPFRPRPGAPAPAPARHPAERTAQPGRRVPRADERLREHRGPVLPGWIAVVVGALALAGCAAVLWRAGVVPAPLVAAFGVRPRPYHGLRATHWPPLAFLGVVTLLSLGGLGRARAGHAWVLTLFGSYRGTVRRTGLTWISPLLLRRRVDVRLRHWRSEPMPAVDSGGLALQVVVQVVWQVRDTARATLAVEDHIEYLAEQVESATARVLSRLPADAFHDDAPTLRDAEAVGEALTRALAADTEAVGIEVFSAQPTRIEYAPEVAEAMRRRRVAAIDAKHRDTVLTAVVDAVDDTVQRLTSRGIVELDDYERKALVKDLTVAFYTGRSDQ
ncbi:SPFH domain-containing protein [Streptomyces sp. NPDC096136]|uniref:SPFH domain-containing protein n=1 Tax=Streptomyces sp. NPDC096136 TaxID=3366076 RepID=UPI00380AA644